MSGRWRGRWGLRGSGCSWGNLGSGQTFLRPLRLRGAWSHCSHRHGRPPRQSEPRSEGSCGAAHQRHFASGLVPPSPCLRACGAARLGAVVQTQSPACGLQLLPAKGRHISRSFVDASCFTAGLRSASSPRLRFAATLRGHRWEGRGARPTAAPARATSAVGLPGARVLPGCVRGAGWEAAGCSTELLLCLCTSAGFARALCGPCKEEQPPSVCVYPSRARDPLLLSQSFCFWSSWCAWQGW